MNRKRIIQLWNKQLQEGYKIKFLTLLIVLYAFMVSCESEPYGSHWAGEDQLTIGQYLEKNKPEYSKFYRLLVGGKMQTTLFAYNPYGDGYTLFLPTDEAIDNFIRQNQDYESFDELLQDTSFIYTFVRYHILKKEVHANDFPFGVLRDSTLTGERLSFGYFTDNDNQFTLINNTAPVTQSNLEMTNGYIHIISEVLQKAEIPGYDWLQQQEGYSILAKAIEISEVKKRLWWKKYTILAEHDSIYNRNGIFSVEDLIARIGTPGMSNTNRSNSFYKFAGYHIVGGEYYLNELQWGNKKYTTLDSDPLTINVGLEIKINPGIENFGFTISQDGDTTFIDYVRPVWDNCNIITATGPVHSISDLLFFQPMN